MKSNFLKKTVSMALAVTMCSGIACSAGFLTKAAELEEIDDNIVAAQSSEVQADLTSQVGANIGNRFKVDGFTYEVTDKTCVAVAGYDYPSANINIPATVSYNQKSYKVTSIGRSAFADCMSLKKVKLPNSITYIANGAFAGCESLQTVDLPDSITSIAFSAFALCFDLQEINLSDLKSLTSIGERAFYCCHSLKEIDLSGLNSLTSIGVEAFDSCYDLQTINLSSLNPLTSIGKRAFVNCTRLEHVFIPNSVTSIGAHAFMNCKNLKTFVVPNRFSTQNMLAGCNNVKVIRYD